MNLKLNLSEISSYYNKLEVNDKINLEINIPDSYDKTDIDNRLYLKLNLSETSNYYYKLEINDKINLKWNLTDS